VSGNQWSSNCSETSGHRKLAAEEHEAPRALAGLRWRRRRVLELKLAGFGYREIMEHLGVTYTNVNRHLTEARAELREAA
jgi:DNA-directed RNA polymerase specialized sigma24 family protein